MSSSYLYILVHWPSMWIYFSNYGTDDDKIFSSPFLIPRGKGKVYQSSLHDRADYYESTCQHIPVCHLSPLALSFILSCFYHCLSPMYLSFIYLYTSSSIHLSALVLFFDFLFWKYSDKSNVEGKWLTLAHNSRAQSIIAGKSRKEIGTSSHTTSTVKIREQNECIHTTLFSFFSLLYIV